MWRSTLFWKVFLLSGASWIALVGILAAATGTYSDEQRLVWRIAGLGGLVLLFFTLSMTRSLAPPLEELTEAAQRIAKGHFGHKVYGAATDDVKALAGAFNTMSEQLAVQFAQVEEDRQQLRTILSGMVEGVIALDGGQRILFSNERAAQLLEFQTESIVGRKLWEVVRVRALQDIVFQALDNTQPYQGELEWKGATPRTLTVHAARLQDMPARGAVLVFHDTTNLRRLERLREEFVANVSHELKTPLAVITACVETLIDWAQEDPVPRAKFLEQINDQSHRLHALILDLLSLARIESGELALDLQNVALEPLVTACLERHRARASANGQVLEAVLMEPASVELNSAQADGARLATEVTAWVDEEAVGQILDNLVDNAVKYTPSGGKIQVRYGLENDWAVLEVEDSGIGIPEADLSRIFERFYRVDKARSRELGGTGLGLSIVKHLVGAMKGTIQARSVLDQGTCFSVRLPRPGSA